MVNVVYVAHIERAEKILLEVIIMAKRRRNLYLDESDYVDLLTIAKREHRTVSNMAGLIIGGYVAAVKRHGGTDAWFEALAKHGTAATITPPME